MEPFEQLTETPYLDAVETELKRVSPGLEKKIWERTTGNTLDASKDEAASWILHVPDCWGEGTRTCPKGANKPGIKKFLAKVQDNISKAERTVDISGFGVPSLALSPAEPFPDGRFAEAIGAGLKEAAKEAAQAKRRLQVRVLTGVMVPTGVLNSFTVSPSKFHTRLMEMIGKDSCVVDLSVASMITREGTSYNHTKLVVVDGKSVIHGGINWMTNFYIEDGSWGARGFGDGAPVTDLDIALRGPAATSAGKFLDELWTWTFKKASAKDDDKSAEVLIATNGKKAAESMSQLYTAETDPVQGGLPVISVGSLGYGILKNDPASEYTPPTADNVDQAACQWGTLDKKSNNETNIDRDFMTVNPDANAICALIKCAKAKIVLSQQDINGFSSWPLYHAHFDVRLIDALADKIMHDVKVRIVISNPGSPDYSNIEHIKEAAGVLFQRVRLRTKTDEQARQAIKNSLQLAPLRLSAYPKWPNDHKYRLHTKVVSVDDKAFYVGSRNTYPDTTQDHGFIIEDATAAQQLNTEFLDKVWEYSKAAIYNWDGHS
jgi:phosphatidylserine/phosphatidylglycerophosphate/cardiolipin synthase-like enzyme